MQLKSEFNYPAHLHREVATEMSPQPAYK